MIRDNFNNTDDDLDNIITKNESKEVLESKEKEVNIEESKTIDDFDFEDFNL